MLKTSLAMPYVARLFEIVLQIVIKVVYFRVRLRRKCDLALFNSAAVLDSKIYLVSVSLQYVHSAGVIHRVSGVVDYIIAVCC